MSNLSSAIAAAFAADSLKNEFLNFGLFLTLPSFGNATNLVHFCVLFKMHAKKFFFDTLPIVKNSNYRIDAQFLEKSLFYLFSAVALLVNCIKRSKSKFSGNEFAAAKNNHVKKMCKNLKN